jgi:hypothetical protein
LSLDRATIDLRRRDHQAGTENWKDREMIALLALAAFIVFIEVAAIRGWGADSRDSRDWTLGSPSRGRRGAVHPPASWLK